MRRRSISSRISNPRAWVAAPTLLTIVVGVTYLIAFRPGRVRAQGPRQPFVLEYIHQNSAVPTLSDHLYLAVRSDGSTAKGPINPQSNISRAIKFASPVRMTVEIHDPTKTISTSYLAPAKGDRTVPDQCAQSGVMGEEVLLGARAFHVRTISQQDANHTVTVDTWRAKDLGCVNLKTVAVIKNNATGSVETDEKIPVSLQLIEPPTRMFEVPQGYAELPPSQYLEGISRSSVSLREGAAAAAAHQLPEGAKNGWQVLDQKYYASQRYKPK